jgi:adenylate cyclase
MHPEKPTPDYSERAIRTVLVVDVAESVRLMEESEDTTISRWRSLVENISSNVLPPHRGRLVKSLGDGMLLDFARVDDAVKAAFDIQGACAHANEGIPSAQHILVRIGMQVSELVADERDVYGRGVNLAARLATVAGPSEIVVSASVREQLTPVLDADIEDLGECYLKHIKQPVRAYRLGPTGPRPIVEAATDSDALRPTLAVIPFSARGASAEEVLGEVLADDIIANFSSTSELNVISRLSTSAFRGRDASLSEVSSHLNAGYVLSGAYRVSGDQIVVTAELAEAKSTKIAWAGEFKGRVKALLKGDGSIVDHIVAEAGAALMARELERAQTQALPNLESWTLLMGAISFMHRLSTRDFMRAHEFLEALAERAPRLAVPQAWLAKWHVLRVWQGWSSDPKEDAQRALERTKRALDRDPQYGLALVIDGLVHMNLFKRLDIAEQRFESALRVNPNDSLGCLLKGTLHAFRGEGREAVAGTQRALRLSPLDPTRYYYDALAAAAALSAGRYEKALELAQRSLRANRTHTSTVRALVVALWQLERFDEARKAALELLRLEPTLTVSQFVERSPSTGFETGRIWSTALRGAGVPE